MTPLPDLKKYKHLTRACFINAPFDRLCPDDLLPFFLDNKLQPEIGLEGNFLWTEPDKNFQEMADKLRDHGLSCTLHAPFHDLVPGGFDSQIISLSRQKLHRAFSLLPVFKPKSIVCHLGFESHKHAHNLDRWLDVSTETWSRLLPLAARENIPVMFENTYELDPSVHLALFSRLKSFPFGFCLDTGHVLAFSNTTWQDWVKALRPWLGQVHLHDNDGTRDAHLAIGAGCFDFAGFFKSIHNKPLLCTLEQRSAKDVAASLEKLEWLKASFLTSDLCPQK
ncbi:sugar phosphate isomerase/epimerase family protein [Desulfogranum marinum]|uniref:sugar phosphate isomerase/epimerase family protein n=1 Tax=Desulfogranum marinum TaxID=453220 RepID=UPI0019632734|nr:sugar phosphate isomerase/epimerase family protein [Desulfogranum marinum]MBM9510818.1 sugar phosphate isomerase/epimerase [Desulfogranum marinum]